MSETEIEDEDLGIKACRGNTWFIVTVTCIMVVYTIVEYRKHEISYKKIYFRMLLILLAPAFFAILALFDLWWETELIPTFVEIVRSLVIAAFVSYIFAMAGATTEGTEVMYNHERMREQIMDVPTYRKREFAKPEVTDDFIKKSKIGSYQFWVIIPIFSILEYIMEKAEYDEEGDYGGAYFIFGVIKFVSTIIAIYYSRLATQVVDRIKDIEFLEVEKKGLWIELGHYIPQIQGIIIEIFAKYGLIADTDEYELETIESWTFNQLFAMEMICLAFAQLLIFKVADFKLLLAINNDRPVSTDSATINKDTYF